MITPQEVCGGKRQERHMPKRFLPRSARCRGVRRLLIILPALIWLLGPAARGDEPQIQGTEAPMAHPAKGRGESETVIRALPQTRLATYELQLPAGYDPQGMERYPLVLLLHGRGSSGAAFAGLAADLGLSGVIYAYPDAPHEIGSGGEGYEYWPRWTRTTHDTEHMVQAARFAAQWCGEIVRDITRRARIDTACVFVTGFSQGGAMAYLAALESPELFTGVAPLGGWVLPAYQDASRFARLKDHDVALFICHGSRDPAIDVSRAETARALAEAAGLDVTYRVHPGGHTLPRSEVAELAAWIRRVCAQRRQP
jgi:phospholipase/carboxylesterase